MAKRKARIRRDVPCTTNTVERAKADARKQREELRRLTGVNVSDDGRIIHIRQTLSHDVERVSLGGDDVDWQSVFQLPKKVLSLLLVLCAMSAVACSGPMASPTAPPSSEAPRVWVSTMKVSASPERVTIGGTSTIAVEVIGSDGQPVSGVSLDVRTLAGTVSTPRVQTDSHGRASFDWTGDVDGTVFVQTGILQGSVTVRVIVPPAAPVPPMPGPPTNPGPPPVVPSCGDAGDVALTVASTRIVEDGTLVLLSLNAFPNSRGNVAVRMVWTFGDGSSAVQEDSANTTHTHQHVYANAGTFSASVVVSCNGGAGVNASAPVVIN